MNEYESIIIVQPNLNDKQLETVLENMKNIIKQYSNKCHTKIIGKRKLAYDIKHYKEGNYVLFEFEIGKDRIEAISEIERHYRITDEILKFIVVKKD